MRKFTYFYSLLLTALFLLPWSGMKAASTLSIGSNDGASQCVPVYGIKANYYIFDQMIYSATELSSMNGQQITHLTFYMRTSGSSNVVWTNMQVRLKEIANSTFASKSSWVSISDATLVYEGSLDATGTTMVVTFDTPYEYNGGNLLIDIRNSSKGTATNSSYGKFQVSSATNTVLYDYNSSQSTTTYTTLSSNRPKITFTYKAAATCKTPKALTKGEVTTTTAAFTWTAGASETSWQYICLPANDDVDWSAAGVQTASPTPAANVSGLSAGTDYKFHVRAYCSSSDQSTEAYSAFKTVYGLPFSEDFTGLTSGIPAGWDNSQGSSSASYKWQYKNTGHSVAPCVFFDSYNNYYGDSYLKTPTIYVDKAATLSFWYKNPTGGDFSVYYSLDGGVTFESNVLATGLTGQSDWTQQEISLPAATIDKNVVIVFKGTSNFGSGDAYIYLDDISVTEVVGCSKPTGVTATDVIYNGATINWDEGSTTNWKLQYSTDQENWTSANSGNWISGATSFNLTGLESGTTYYAQIQADGCDKWSNAISFTPNCVVPTGLEVPAATIESNSAVVNWTAGNGETNWTLQYKKSTDASWSEPIAVATNPTYTLTGISAASTYQVKVAATCNDTYTSAVSFDTKCGAVSLPFVEDFSASNDCWTKIDCELGSIVAGGTFMFAYNDAPPQYLISPELTVSVNDVKVEFDYKARGDWNETFQVGYSTTTSDVSAFTWDDEISYNNKNTAAKYSKTFSAGVTFVAIKYTADDQYGLYIDNFSVSEYIAPTCFAPTDLVNSTPSKNSVTLSWTKGNESDDAWVVEYSTASNFSGSTEVPAATNSSFVLSGLSAQTTYYVRVKTKCGESEYSDPSDAINFTTDCPAQAIPFEEDFSSSIPCWKMVDCTSGTGVGSGAFRFQYNSNPPQYLISPELEASAKALQVAFDYKVMGAMFPESFKVGYSTTTKEISAFTWGDEQTDLTNTDYTNYVEPLPAGVAYVAIQYTSNNQAVLFIDNFSVSEAPSCFAPTGLSAATSITPEGATFTWSASGHGEDTYQWAVAVGSAAPEWVDDAAHKVNSTTKTLTGLTAGTNYKFYVRSYCDSEDQSAHVVSALFSPVLNAPTDIAASAITATGATISWTAAAGVSNYEYSLRGSDKMLPDWNSAVAVNGATSVNLDELTANTTYHLWVRSVYNTSKSGNSTMLTFTTKCEGITVTSAYTENFNSLDNGTIPGCWDNSEGTTTTASYKWKAATGGQSGKCLVFNGVDNGYNKTNILATPTFTLSSDADLVFYWKNAKTGAYKVQVSVDGAAREDLITGLVSQSSWTKAEQPLTDYNGHSVQFFFCGTSANDGSANLYLDEFQIVPVTCRKPATINPVTEFTATTATVTWTASGTETDYQYAVALKDEAPVWDPANVVEALSVELTGLTPITNYDVYVRTYCSVSEQSEAQKVSFQTACGIVNAPIEIEFSNALPGCWTASDATYTWAPYNRGAGNYCVRFDSYLNGNGNTADLTTAQIKVGDNMALTFDCKNKDGGAFSVDMYVAETDETIQIFDDLTGIADWTEKVYNLSSYSGKTVNFIFHGTSNEADYYNGVDAYLYVDNFRVVKNIILADDVDNTSTLSALKASNETLDITIGRTFVRAGYYNTICLPFSLSAAELAASPIASDDLWAFRYIKVDGDSLYIRIIPSETIEAGVPYLIAWPAGDNIANPLFKNVTISATEGKSVGDSDLKFVGILKPEPFATGDKKKLFVAANNELYWWKGDHDSQLNGFRAFFYVNSGNGSLFHGMPARIVKDDKVATGVENVQGEGQTIKLLENNQVVIIRNGVKYTIQGQKIQ